MQVDEVHVKVNQERQGSGSGSRSDKGKGGKGGKGMSKKGGVDRNTSHVIFSCILHAFHDVYHATLAQVSARAHHTMVIHDVRLIDRLFALCSSPCVSPTPCSSLPTSTCTLS